MNLRQKIEEDLETGMFMDGFDNALIGCAQVGGKFPVPCYSISKIIKILMKDMSYEEALDYLDYNILGGYLGEKTPIFLEDYEDEMYL